jgi:hypothetical protein
VTEQRTVIVTGAGTGIGAATAARLQAKGWRVFATMRRPDPAHHGPDALALDVTSDDSVGAAVKCRTAGNLLTQIISSSSEGTLERRSIRMCLLRCMALLLVHNSLPFGRTYSRYRRCCGLSKCLARVGPNLLGLDTRKFDHVAELFDLI